jgi:hypothetical protein
MAVSIAGGREVREKSSEFRGKREEGRGKREERLLVPAL